jgi:hypothetical protein
VSKAHQDRPPIILQLTADNFTSRCGSAARMARRYTIRHRGIRDVKVGPREISKAKR